MYKRNMEHVYRHGANVPVITGIRLGLFSNQAASIQANGSKVLSKTVLQGVLGPKTGST